MFQNSICCLAWFTGFVVYQLCIQICFTGKEAGYLPVIPNLTLNPKNVYLNLYLGKSYFSISVATKSKFYHNMSVCVC